MIIEKLAQMLADKLDMDASEINAETLFADLGMDSLDIAELLMDIEDEFGVTVEPNPDYKTVGDFAEAIEKLQNEAK